jgi:hypothetical protein
LPATRAKCPHDPPSGQRASHPPTTLGVMARISAHDLGRATPRRQRTLASHHLLAGAPSRQRTLGIEPAPACCSGNRRRIEGRPTRMSEPPKKLTSVSSFTLDSLQARYL